MYICKDDKNTELMKRILTLTLLALSALAAAAQPDTPVVKYLKGDIRRAAFNTHSYEFEPVKDTPAPKGYKAAVQAGPRPPHPGQGAEPPDPRRRLPAEGGRPHL